MSKSTINLGATPPSDAQRDAVHVAVVPMTAFRAVCPGERVNRDGKRCAFEVGVGIVDP